MWLLIGTLHNEESFEFELVPDRLTIGRAPACSIQLNDETVSGLHAEIVCVGVGKHVLRDLGSKNGTFVDGVAISEAEISGPCKIAFGAVPFEIEARNDTGKPSAGEVEQRHEARLREKQEECDALSAEIDDLERAHCSAIEMERREYSSQIDDFERRNEACSMGMQEKCDALIREIDERKKTHSEQLERERQEHGAKIGEIEKSFEARLKEKDEKCDALARAMEALKRTHETQFANERRDHAAEIEKMRSEARLKEKQDERERLTREVEALQRTPGNKAGDQSTGHAQVAQEVIPADLNPGVVKDADYLDPAEKLQHAVSSPAAKPSGPERPKHAKRRKIGRHAGALLCIGFLGFGLCLIAQTIPSVLPSIKPLSAVGLGDRTQAASKSVAESQQPPHAAAAGTSTKAPTVNAAASDGGGEIGNDRRTVASIGGTVGTGRTNDTSHPETAPETPAPAAQLINPDGVKALEIASQMAGVLCPCVAGGPRELKGSAEIGLPEIAEGPATDAPNASTQDQTFAERAAPDLIAESQSEPVDADQGANGSEVGFKLQEEERLHSDNSNLTPEQKEAVPGSPAEEKSNFEPGAPLEKEITANDGRHSLDQAKNEAPLSLSKVLRPKEAPGGQARSASPALRVLILGDSLSLCGFGKRLDEKFRADSQVQAVFTYMACGVNPLSWIKEKPYANVKTHCGFWSIESSAGQPAEVEDVYGMKQGYVPKSHPVPKVEDLLQSVHPDVLIMQCGTNLFELFPDRTTVNPDKDGPKVRKYVAPFLNAARQCPTLKKIYWVAPPTSGRTSNEIQDFVFNEIRTCANEIASVIDSRTLVTYPYHQMEPDREHFIGSDMTQWADRVFSFVKQDFCSEPFPSLPAIAQLATPANPKASAKTDDPATEKPLYVRAKLTFKSPPIPLKELLPYQESLVGFVYDVNQVVAGKYEEKQILVLHPACIGLKPQPLEKYRMGRYKLRLHELESTAWHTVKSQDESGRIDLIPYIQVDDEKKFPGNSH